ncbi:MAG: hypothetical protein ACTSQE_12390 [Candidatus Heimdallarchaeaceae archaeon]
MIRTVINDQYYLDHLLKEFDQEVRETQRLHADFVCVRPNALERINRIFLLSGVNRLLISREFLNVIRDIYKLKDISVTRGYHQRETFKGLVGYYLAAPSMTQLYCEDNHRPESRK